jgi:hypothetical protein
MGNSVGNKATEAVLLERTAHPGVYRRGGQYVAVYRRDGRQRKESAATFAEARATKLARELLGDVAEEALERIQKTVMWVLFLITEGGAIAATAGLFGLGTVWRVLFGLGRCGFRSTSRLIPGTATSRSGPRRS